MRDHQTCGKNLMDLESWITLLSTLSLTKVCSSIMSQ